MQYTSAFIKHILTIFSPSPLTSISGDAVLRCFIMKKKIEKLMAPGGLEDDPAFAEFIEEYNSFPELGAVENCGKNALVRW